MRIEYEYEVFPLKMMRFVAYPLSLPCGYFDHAPLFLYCSFDNLFLGFSIQKVSKKAY